MITAVVVLSVMVAKIVSQSTGVHRFRVRIQALAATNCKLMHAVVHQMSLALIVKQ